MSFMSQFLRGTGPEASLDVAKFRSFANEELGKIHSRSTEEQAKALSERNKLVSSIAGVTQLNSIEGDYQYLNIMRDLTALDFMEVRDLPLGTLPIYRTRTKNPVGFHLGGLAGAGGSHYYATSDAASTVNTFTIATDEIMLPNLNNIYDMERVAQRREALEWLARAKTLATEVAAFNTVLGATDVVNTDPAAQIATYFGGGGSFSGKNVYSLDPGVIVQSVPTVNVYDLSSEDGLTKKVFQTLNTHSMQIQRKLVKMYIPAGAAGGHSPVWETIQNMSTPVSLVTGSGVNTDQRKAIPSEMWSEFQKTDFRGAIKISWLGLDIELERVNWMPNGYCFITTDQPAGIMWKRLSLATGNEVEGSLETPQSAFYSRRSEAENLAMIRPDFCLRNFLVIKVQ
jgi:hypothetical protein